MASPDKLIIETPEQTSLDFPLAGIGSRFLAMLADTAVQALIAVVLLILAALLVPLVPRLRLGISSQWVVAAGVLVVFLINSGYFALFEALWNGQTPGKRMARIRVIKDDGRPISVYDAVGRNLLRLVDQMPALYGVGILTVLLNKRNKRLGDYVAGTVVIHEKTMEGVRPYLETDSDLSAPSYDTSVLTIEEMGLIETFFSRCDSFEPIVRTSMAAQITERISGKLGVEVRGWPQTENFLAAVLKQYRATGRYRAESRDGSGERP